MKYWFRPGVLPWQELERFIDPVGPLWINGYSSNAGLNDRVPLDRVTELGGSLALIAASKSQLHVFAPGEAFGNPKRRVQLQFKHAGEYYALWVTDPVIERDYLTRPDGAYSLGESYLTVSVGEPYNGYCYKLIAAVIGKQ